MNKIQCVLRIVVFHPWVAALILFTLILLDFILRIVPTLEAQSLRLIENVTSGH